MTMTIQAEIESIMEAVDHIKGDPCGAATAIREDYEPIRVFDSGGLLSLDNRRLTILRLALPVLR